jgi:hypothetical protein
MLCHFFPLSTCTENGQRCNLVSCVTPNCNHGLQLRRKSYECCRTCACVVWGLAFYIGEEIPDSDPCTNCSCTENGQLCTAKGCAVPNCSHGLQPIRKRNECCQSCGCVVNGISFDIGEEIPDNDPCTNCTCTENGQICTAKGCAVPNCSHGLQPIRKRNECCQSCGCVVNGISFDIGEEIPDNDPCTNCTCTENGQICTPSRTPQCT